ncbi:hypothetical protein [Capnocytophaga canimorsus]|uniref:hypothetical protein n=1 Tax=Capnocytophaga canimorsus TaxID=28188 RepID=UPI000F6F0F16|nr:hypothetical protein [Capnocytophaga canimorsus]VEJ19516.1 Uncharacterised protein [Capnocytophaga canimorsus]
MRGGAKALSKAEPAVALVAKKADNTDGFELIYKSVNDIQANEFHVATSIDGRQSQEFLEQTKKHLDKNAVKKQVDESWIKGRDIKSKKHRFLNSYKNPMFYCILKTNLF